MYTKVFLAGHVGQVPALRTLPSGQGLLTFSLAVNRYVTRDGQPQQEVTWWQIVVFGKLAEVCNQHLTKGQLVFVEGDRVKAHAWMDATTHAPRAGLELTARAVRFLGSRPHVAEDEVPASQVPAEADETPF